MINAYINIILYWFIYYLQIKIILPLYCTIFFCQSYIIYFLRFLRVIQINLQTLSDHHYCSCSQDSNISVALLVFMLHLSVFDVFSKYFYCLSFGTSYWFNVIFRIIYLFFYLNRSIIKFMFIQSFVCSLLITINFSILILFFYFEKTYLQNAFIFGTPTENPWPFHSLFIISIIYLIKIIFIFV